MDQELIAYLDERFHETSQQIQALREETTQQFQGLREETTQQFQGLREETTQQFQGLREETTQQIQGLREETTQQIQGLREETARQFQEVREEATQQIQGLREETARQFQEVREESNGRFERVEAGIRQTQVMVEGVRSDLQLVAEGVIGSNEKIEALRGELGMGLDELRYTIRRLPYADLQNRVSALESWRETRERDPIDIIREKFGRPKKED